MREHFRSRTCRGLAVTASGRAELAALVIAARDKARTAAARAARLGLKDTAWSATCRAQRLDDLLAAIAEGRVREELTVAHRGPQGYVTLGIDGFTATRDVLAMRIFSIVRRPPFEIYGRPVICTLITGPEYTIPVGNPAPQGEIAFLRPARPGDPS